MARYEYAAESIVPAPVEQVWAVLADVEAYGEWNPFTPVARTSLTVGEPIDMRVHMATWGLTISQRETVRVVERNERLVWGTEMLFGMIRAERTQTLEALDEGRTRYRTVDVIEGPLSGLSHLLFGASVQRGFEAVAIALAERLAASGT